MKSDFDSYIESKQSRTEHAQEIISSRVGGLGGSDAALVLRVGAHGLAGLTANDHKRLSVMLGLTPPDNWGGNKFTDGGHRFEDHIAQDFPHWEREVLMEQPLAKTFRTFAHADFTHNGRVAELKFVTTKTTDKVVRSYAAQLQWYYLLGAKSVTLLHGTGTIDDAEKGTTFHVEDVQAVQIDRDDAMIALLIGGLKTLDEAIASGWEPPMNETQQYGNLPTMVQGAFQVMEDARRMAAKASEMQSEAKNVLKAYFDETGYSRINGCSGDYISMTKPKVSRRFDVSAFSSNLTEYDDGHMFTLAEIIKIMDDSYSTSISSPSITYYSQKK